MNTRTENLPRNLRLEHKALYSLPDASELAVTCEEGAVWLTVDGDLQDYVLEAGETFETQDHGRVLIYALADSRISIADAIPAHEPARWHGLRLPARLSAGHA
jgi:hypothetical protein